jgi:4-hydroxy-4-methyl-2-oxoglutarate aldolase
MGAMVVPAAGSSPHRLDDALLVRAGRLGTASLHEAAGRRGALPHVIKPLAPSMHAAGRAFPVRAPVGDNLWLHRAIVAAEAGDLLVVDAGDGAGYGYWGEIMASAAIARNLAGIVITGGVSDGVRLIELGLPTFCTGLAIQGTAKDPAGAGRLGEPVHIGEIVVERGDLVVGDADGVFCISARQAAEAVTSAERRDAAESEILERISRGETTIKIYNLPSEDFN